LLTKRLNFYKYLFTTGLQSPNLLNTWYRIITATHVIQKEANGIKAISH